MREMAGMQYFLNGISSTFKKNVGLYKICLSVIMFVRDEIGSKLLTINSTRFGDRVGHHDQVTWATMTLRPNTTRSLNMSYKVIKF